MTASMQVISYAKVINIEKHAQGRPNGFIPDEALGRPVEMFLGAWVPLVACGTLPDATWPSMHCGPSFGGSILPSRNTSGPISPHITAITAIMSKYASMAD